MGVKVSNYTPLGQSAIYGFRLTRWSKPFYVDLNISMKEKLKLDNGRHEVTKDVAIKALKQIERASRFKSFITKPAVVILTGIALLGASIGLAFATNAIVGSVALIVSLKVAAYVIGATGGIFVGYGLRNIVTRFLPVLSSEYNKQAQQARQYIQELEDKDNSYDGVVLLASEKLPDVVFSKYTHKHTIWAKV
jgi:hypothetical protein